MRDRHQESGASPPLSRERWRGHPVGAERFEADREGSSWRDRFGGEDWEQPRFAGEARNLETRRRFGPHAGKGPKGFRQSDDRILEDVNVALERDPEIDATEIETACSDGEVVLRGLVSSRREKHLAEQCIEELPGVRDVRNELRIQNPLGARPASAGASDATHSPSRRERGETAYS